MENALIRSLSPDDTAAVSKLEPDLFGADAWSARLVGQELASPWAHYLGIFVEQELVGYGGIKGDLEADLMTIGVAASWRGLGLGRRLLDALLEAARVKGVEAVFLEVRESNVSARGLYERAGFKEVGRIPGYYRNPAEEAVRMVLARTQARQGERRPKYPKERVS